MSGLAAGECFAQKKEWPAVVIHGLNEGDTIITLAQLKAAKGLDLLHAPSYTIMNYVVVIQIGEADILEATCKSALFTDRVLEELNNPAFSFKIIWLENIVATTDKGQLLTFPNQRLRIVN